MLKMTFLLKVFVCCLFVNYTMCENKYSRSSNEGKKLSENVDFRKLEKPFRMNKLNLVWSKAQHVSRQIGVLVTIQIIYFRGYVFWIGLGLVHYKPSNSIFSTFQRLTEPKLKSLYSDLMIQDKEELTLKRLKSDGSDKEGLKEAEIRRKLTNIMTAYGLREHFDEGAPARHKDHEVST